MAEFAEAPLTESQTTDESVTQEVTETESPATPESEGTGNNPAWQPLLDKLPAQLRPMIEPDLKSWDENYRALNDKYTKLKGLEEFSTFDPNEVRAALQVAQRIANNPREVADIMAGALGLTLQEQKELEKELKEEEAPQKPQFTEEDDPRLVQIWEENEKLKAQQQQFFEQFEQREVEKERVQLEQYYDQEITSELGKLYTHDPAIKGDDLRMKDLMKRAFLFAEQGSDSPIVDAYNEQAELLKSNIQRAAPQKTPLFMPTSGNAPPVSNQLDLSTEEGKRAKAQELIAALKQG